MRLTDAHHRKLIRAGVLMARHGHRLSTFEVETITDVNERLRAFGHEGSTTDAEWSVVEDALAAMEADRHPRPARLRRAA